MLEIGLGENKVTSDMLEVIKVELSEITMLSVTIFNMRYGNAMPNNLKISR